MFDLFQQFSFHRFDAFADIKFATEVLAAVRRAAVPPSECWTSKRVMDRNTLIRVGMQHLEHESLYRRVAHVFWLEGGSTIGCATISIGDFAVGM